MEGANVDMVVKVESNDLDLLPTEADGPCDSSPGSGRSLGDDETMIHCSISVSTETRVDGFLQREAKRMARNSCLYFWISLIASISLSFVAILQGGLSIEASSQGWTTRGTTIADRQTASILVRMNRKYLSSGGEDAWNDLTNNIQPSWESVRTDDTIKHQKTARRERHRDDNRHRRRLPRGPRGTSFDNLDLDEDDQENAADWYPNMMRHRKLNETMHNTLGSCASRVYNSADFQWLPKLWPVWKSTSGKSLLSPDHLHELCVAEEKTQQVLSQNNLCVRCEQSCLPPFSIVLFARLTIPNGFGLTCEELHEAWKPYRKSTEAKLKSCVADLEDSASVAAGVDASLPMSCPFGFSSHMVDLNFLETGVLLYTSSIFVTDSEKLAEIYSLIGQFDRGGQSVAAAYDTQKQNFNLRFQNEVLKRDIALAFGSAVIVIAAIFVHTRSIFITFVGILQIGLCFPLAHFVYVFVAGYSFFPILNFLGIFVAFALGADDVFVAVDKWKNARLDDKTASTIEIAAVALPDAAKAMLLTTLTTSLAFFATGVCPVAPIKLFANFVGILVMLVYCLCILLVFPALCLRDKALQKSTDIICLDDKPSRCEDRSNKETTDFPGTHSSLIRRLMTGYHQFIWKYRYFSLFVCLVILASCIYSTTMLEPTRSLDVRLLDESTEFERNYQWRQQLLHEDLLKSVGSLSYVFWGVNPVDNGDHNDPESFTNLVLDETFDPSSTGAQLFLLDFCDEFHQQPFASEWTSSYVCPLTRFDKWLRRQNTLNPKDQETIYSSVCESTEGIPVPEQSFHACIAAWAREAKEVNVLLRNEKLLILSIPFRARIGYTDNFEDLKHEFWAIENWLKFKLRSAPQAVSRAFFTGNDFWFMDTYQAMTYTAYSSAAIALISSALVIFISSRSVALTVFSVVSILYILAATTATMVALGWTLGFLECICIAILIGISADFVTHLSAAYTADKGNVDRKERTQRALVSMGPSILAAAFTTTASSVVMIFTVIVFFHKFAFVLLITIIHSTSGAFIFFCTLTNCLGPCEPGQFVKRTTKYINRMFQIARDLSTQSSKTHMKKIGAEERAS